MCLAIPGRVESICVEDGLQMGKINFGGIIKVVCLAYVPEIQIGDYALVHVGFAISKVDAAIALETLRTFDEIGVLQEGLQELRETNFEHEVAENPARKIAPANARDGAET